jgi:anti-sigma B factor antagonist
MEIETKVVNGITVAKLCDTRLDAAQAVRFKEGLRELSEGGAEHIVLDMTDIVFMDSSGLGAVVSVMKQMGRDKTLELAALTTAVAKVFTLTRMDKIFGIYPSVEDALSKGMKAAG